MSELVTDIRAAGLSASGQILAKNLAEGLHKNYPNHLWGVHVDEKGGIATVRNLSLSGRWGFVLHIKDIDAEGRSVMRAGGELLERFNLRRGAANHDHIQDLATDFSGNKVFHSA